MSDLTVFVILAIVFSVHTLTPAYVLTSSVVQYLSQNRSTQKVGRSSSKTPDSVIYGPSKGKGRNKDHTALIGLGTVCCILFIIIATTAIIIMVQLRHRPPQGMTYLHTVQPYGTT